jgi:hypothetical protein
MSGTTVIWWREEDEDTEQQIDDLGGKDAIEPAVQLVLANRKVLLRSLTPGISGAKVFRASPVVVTPDGDQPEVDGVIKIGRAADLAKEVANYQDWVKNMMQQQSDFAYLDHPNDIAAIAAHSPEAIVAINYRHVGRTTFGNHIAGRLRSGDVGDACDAVDRLLAILRPWQEQMRVQTGKSLTSDGVYAFGVDPFPQFEAVCRRLDEMAGVPHDDTLHMCRSVAALWRSLRPQRMLETALHGDLHTENIMVSDGGHISLIDFAACGRGHFLRDVCTLEAHLLMRALVPDPDAPLEPYLADIDALYDRHFLIDPFGNAGTTPVRAVITRIRRYAHASLMNGNAEYLAQYAFAVLRHAIRIVIRTDDSTTDHQRRTALHVARLVTTALTTSDGQLEIVLGERRPPTLAFLDGAEGRWFDADGLNPSALQVCTADTWSRLADEMMAAQRIDICGIAPVALLNELLQRAEAVSRQSRRMYLNYVTTVPPGRETFGLGYAHPRWRGPLTGMRNLVRALQGVDTAGSALELTSSIRMSSRVSENCMIRLQRLSGHPRLLEIARLSEADEQQPGMFTVSLNRDQDGRWENWIQQTLGASTEILLREVICESRDDELDETGADTHAFRPLTPAHLAPYGDATALPGLRPIAMTILRTQGARGVGVLMKYRSWLTDNDSFDLYSFLSTRILAEDLARTANVTIMPRLQPDDDREYLWELVGKPSPWKLEHDVFLAAARRDVYACTLLEIDPARFQLKGMHLVRRHENEVTSCFVVFVVELEREEVEQAVRSSRGMLEGVIQPLMLVRADQIFDGSLDTNEFSKQRAGWLRAECL